MIVSSASSLDNRAGSGSRRATRSVDGDSLGCDLTTRWEQKGTQMGLWTPVGSCAPGSADYDGDRNKAVRLGSFPVCDRASITREG